MFRKKGENKVKRTLVCLLVAMFAASLVLAACGDSGKGAAETALKAAEEAIKAVKDEVSKVVPEQANALEDALAAAKEKFAKSDFKAAMEEAKGLVGKSKEVLAAAKAKTEELTKKWTEFSEEIPKMMEDLKSRVDALSQQGGLPAGLTSEKFEAVKSQLASAREEWDKALESFKNGFLADSVSIAAAVKEKTMKAMEALGFASPPAVKT